MKIPFYEIRDYREIGALLDQAHARVMESGQYILGPEVAAFEYEFALYNGTAHCVGVGNGLDALTLTLRAWGICPGDEVIVPSNTYIATWLAVSNCGATPVPVEPDPGTYNVDPHLIEAAITPRTRACIVVHLYGRLADLPAIHAVCQRHGVHVLSDAAQGAGLPGLGHVGAAAFSFYPTKNLGCFGDGGAVVTNDSQLAARIRRLANYGSDQKYYNPERGVNSRLDELQAAYLRVKLPFLDRWNFSRWRAAARYINNLQNVVGLTLPDPVGQHVWHLFVVRTAERDRLRAWLLDQGIETMVHYPLPPHLQQAYADHTFPILWVAATLADEVLSLPLWPGIPNEVIDRVCWAIAKH